MQIKQSIERIPGGMMIVPLLLGAAINTLFPGLGKTLGSFTNAWMTGSLPILSVPAIRQPRLRAKLASHWGRLSCTRKKCVHL